MTISDTYQRAIALLAANNSPIGLRAGQDAYPQVWARDAVISGLGIAATGDSTGKDILARSLRSLAFGQSRLGRIPNHLVANGRSELVADSMFAGAVDPSLWFILGHYVLNDSSELAAAWPSIERAYHWLEFQDSNECGLLEVHESADWADMFANRYNSLLPNVLWFAANRAMGLMASRLGRESEYYSGRAGDIKFKLNQLLWYGPEVRREMNWIQRNRREWIYPVQLAETVLGSRPFYLPYMAYRDFGDRLDTFGNLLAVLFGLADETQSARILDYIAEIGADEPWPVKACWPPVTPGDADWREYYRRYNLNQPHQYHNGGAWPFLGGFYVAALMRAGRKDSAAAALDRLEAMNHLHRGESEWEFNEWFHGQSGKPMGNAGQSWSAGMFLYAAEIMDRGDVPFFSPSDGW
jgi:glycogen debranching enzyme